MKPLVFQSDFGLVDGSVSAMYGVAYTANPQLRIHDLTHDITPFSIWEASQRHQGSIARAYNVGTGNSWRIRMEPFKGFF